jgi:hypothetical protein
VNQLLKNGIEIKRHHLSGEPQAYTVSKNIRALLAKEGAYALPIPLAKK